jgi:DNA primase
VREGRNVSVRCLLHPDKRRSAVIDTIENLYFCHTCSQGGNAVNIVMIKEGVEFKDAHRIAVDIAEKSGVGVHGKSQRAGVKLPRRTWDI